MAQNGPNSVILTLNSLIFRDFSEYSVIFFEKSQYSVIFFSKKMIFNGPESRFRDFFLDTI